MTRDDIIHMAREWLPKAYRDGDIGDEPKFTKHNMEVAFAAGAAAERKSILQMSEDQWFPTQLDYDDAIHARGAGMKYPKYLNAAYEGDDLYTGDQLRAAVLAEREACEKVCDDLWQEDGTAFDCREAIRARSQS